MNIITGLQCMALNFEQEKTVNEFKVKENLTKFPSSLSKFFLNENIYI